MTENHTEYRKRVRKDGIWEIAWTDPKTGKARRESCSTRDTHVAEKKLAEKVLSGDIVPPEITTIGRLLDLYHNYIKKNKTVRPQHKAHF